MPMEALDKMLALAAAQLNSSVAEGSESVHTLTRSFTQMVTDLDHLLAQLQTTSADTRQISQTADELRSSINTAVVAFQFYDRLTQRIAHTSDSLNDIKSLLSDNQRTQQIEAWTDLQQGIKHSYTMEAERLMFEHIMAGHSIDDAVAIYQQHKKQQPTNEADNGDIEFF